MPLTHRFLLRKLTGAERRAQTSNSSPGFCRTDSRTPGHPSLPGAPMPRPPPSSSAHPKLTRSLGSLKASPLGPQIMSPDPLTSASENILYPVLAVEAWLPEDPAALSGGGRSSPTPWYHWAQDRDSGHFQDSYPFLLKAPSFQKHTLCVSSAEARAHSVSLPNIPPSPS